MSKIISGSESVADMTDTARHIAGVHLSRTTAQATCSCGWSGKYRKSTTPTGADRIRTGARAEAKKHAATASNN